VRLPLPGDAVRAAAVLNERVEAATGAGRDVDMVDAGWAEFTPTAIKGPGASAFHAAYGDLFDMLETMGDAGFGALITNHRREIESGSSTADTALTAIVLQGIAFGVLMERLRWERGS
jgi:hypothetical protein